MGLFVPRPGMERGEQLALQFGANRSRGNRAVGGRLFVTDRRLIFSPNILDRLTGQKVWSCPLEEIDDVGSAARSAELFSGGLRERLRVRLKGGGEELFVVNRLDHVIADLIGAVQG